MGSESAGIEGAVTRLLEEARDGKTTALDRLLPIVYDELRRIADMELRRESPGHTLRATALVHEAYFKLTSGSAIEANDRGHFLAVAARAMRQVLVDYARKRKSAKRGGDWIRTTLNEGSGAREFDADELLALDRAMEELDPRQRQVVDLQFFAGLEGAEIAEVLGLSERTVRRDWAKARAWLYQALYPDSSV
jgi:RNA polymerase sigma factor (TIGR02999 family)